jgi:hypothetical protein
MWLFVDHMMALHSFSTSHFTAVEAWHFMALRVHKRAAAGTNQNKGDTQNDQYEHDDAQGRTPT